MSTSLPARNSLQLVPLGIDTYKDAVIYLRHDSHICQSEGLEAHSRVQVRLGEKTIIATIHTIKSELLRHNQASLSEYAWTLLGAKEGQTVEISHPAPLLSLEHIRHKIDGKPLDGAAFDDIIHDVTTGRLSDIHVSAFLTACADDRLSVEEIQCLTDSMVRNGNRLHWHSGADIIVDKHCVGGLPGNRTTPLVVAIVAAYGLTMPKTSSRAITSPAGTADTMEVLAPVELDLAQIRHVVEQENGCVAWGGAVDLSPADDLLIRVERALGLDSEGQLVASVLSKKIAAGATHVVIDIPVGPTAKIRSRKRARALKSVLETVGGNLGLTMRVLLSDGRQPVGHGIGPALEARDVLRVLQCDPQAPQDLRDHALMLAGAVLEFSPRVPAGQGLAKATELLDSGAAWKKFQRICEAQGGLRSVPVAPHQHVVEAPHGGVVTHMDTYKTAQLAKLAGAPNAKVAGVDLHVKLGTPVTTGQPLYTLHAQSPGELAYALDFIRSPQNHPLRISQDALSPSNG